MVTKSGVWFLVIAFLSFVISPDHAGAEAVPSAPEATMISGIESPLPTDPADTHHAQEGFSVRESLQLAQAVGAQDMAREETTGTRTEGSEAAAGNETKREGLSAGATIALVIIGVVLVGLAVAAVGARGGSGHVSGLNLNFGK